MQRKIASYLFLLLTVGLICLSCGDGGSGAQTPVKTKDSTTVVLPAFTFDTTYHNFGSIQEGTVVEHTYRFVNSGKAPLIISNVSAQCGCTVADFAKKPVAVGDSASITVKFNSKDRTGLQNKEITIVANTEPALTSLILRGEVINDKP